MENLENTNQVSEKKSYTKVILIAIVGILIIGVLGFFIYNSFNTTNDNNQIYPQVNNTITISGNSSEIVNSNNEFAMDLYSRYKSKEGNVFYSPFSISSALSMTYEGEILKGE